jgi:hypothetical protein
MNIVEGVSKQSSGGRNHGLCSTQSQERMLRQRRVYPLIGHSSCRTTQIFVQPPALLPLPLNHSYCVDWSRLKLTHVMTFLVASCCGWRTLRAITLICNKLQKFGGAWTSDSKFQRGLTGSCCLFTGPALCNWLVIYLINGTVTITWRGAVCQNNWWSTKDLEGSFLTE